MQPACMRNVRNKHNVPIGPPGPAHKHATTCMSVHGRMISSKLHDGLDLSLCLVPACARLLLQPTMTRS